MNNSQIFVDAIPKSMQASLPSHDMSKQNTKAYILKTQSQTSLFNPNNIRSQKTQNSIKYLRVF